nr:MAG TPA: hypothetical protein [Caudoviricetes sp.]
MKYSTKFKILMVINLIWIGLNMYLIIDCALSNQYLGELCYFILYFISLCTFYSMQAKMKTNRERNIND